MRAYVLDELGKPGEVRELPDPVPADGEVLIRVHAASINPWDAVVVNGGAKNYGEHRFPFIPGVDAAGTVQAVGAGVEAFKVGDEVVASSAAKPHYGAGTFAQLVTVPADDVGPSPRSLSMGEASTLPQAGLTALAAVEALEPAAGRVIAVVGAAGAVGSFFIQLAAKRGAMVIALARPQNADYARGLGATDVIDHTADAVAAIHAQYPDGIDAIADFTGNATIVGGLSILLKDGGQIASSASRQIDADLYAKRGIKVHAANRLPLSRLAALSRLVDSEGIRAPQIEWRSLDEAAAALTQVGRRHNRGKVVLKID